MKILHLDPLPDDPGYFSYFTEDYSQYYKFRVTAEERSIEELTWSFPIRNYEHFAGIMGKFDLYTIFLAEPIPVTELTLEELKRVEEKYPANLWKFDWA
jgi:hypothetical protein